MITSRKHVLIKILIKSLNYNLSKRWSKLYKRTIGTCQDSLINSTILKSRFKDSFQQKLAK